MTDQFFKGLEKLQQQNPKMAESLESLEQRIKAFQQQEFPEQQQEKPGNVYNFEAFEKLMEQTAGAEIPVDVLSKMYPAWQQLQFSGQHATWNLSPVERLVAYIDKMQQATQAYESPGRTISADTSFQYILNYALTLVYEQDSSLLHNRRSYAEDQALDLMLAAQERLQLQEDNTGSQQ